MMAGIFAVAARAKSKMKNALRAGSALKKKKKRKKGSGVKGRKTKKKLLVVDNLFYGMDEAAVDK